jgi:hypothetical protein
VAGMPRSGTTFLYHNLNKHPNIFLPFRKEVNFFNVRYDLGINWYHDLYKERNKDQICGDISPPCFLDVNSIDRIKEYNSNAKIIFSVRDPVEWALSFYSQFSSFKFNMPPFKDFLDGYEYTIKNKSLFVKFKNDEIIDTIDLFMKQFGENILVYDFSFFKKETLSILKAIEKFVGVPPFFESHNFDNVKINASNRRNLKFVSNILQQEWFISFLQKVIPRKIVLHFRNRFDKVSAKNTSKNSHKSFYTSEDIKLAESELSGQRAQVRKLFEGYPLILGTGKPFKV